MSSGVAKLLAGLIVASKEIALSGERKASAALGKEQVKIEDLSIFLLVTCVNTYHSLHHALPKKSNVWSGVNREHGGAQETGRSRVPGVPQTPGERGHKKGYCRERRQGYCP